jgi:hypothetical protein
MASQPIEPQPGDVADERGRFAPIEQPGDEAPRTTPGAAADGRSGSLATEDDPQGRPAGPERPPVGQPAHGTQPSRP